MSNRAAVKSAFEGLRPSIVREPSRTVIAPQDESKLLQTPVVTLVPDQTQTQPSAEAAIDGPAAGFATAGLLKKKKREVLVPVTFRIPQALKEQLDVIAKKHELTQTDLINEGIQLNLQRYR